MILCDIVIILMIHYYKFYQRIGNFQHVVNNCIWLHCFINFWYFNICIYKLNIDLNRNISPRVELNNSLSKVNIWNVNCVRSTAFIIDTRKNVLVKVSKFLRQKICRPEGDSNPNLRIHAESSKHFSYSSYYKNISTTSASIKNMGQLWW